MRISRKDFSTLFVSHWKYEFSQRSAEIEDTEFDEYPDIEPIIFKAKGSLHTERLAMIICSSLEEMCPYNTKPISIGESSKYAVLLL
jgi:hypothetical protein